MSKLKIAVIEGTTREQRKSINVAEYIAKKGEEREEVEIILVDPRNFTFEGDGNDDDARDENYTNITAEADAFFVVVPEYNHSFPGSLKRMLDTEYDNYLHKPVAIAGVSSGRFGGVRAIEALVPVLRELGMVVLSFDAQVGNSYKAFDENGQPTQEGLEERIDQLYDELIWFARTLKKGKEELSDKHLS